MVDDFWALCARASFKWRIVKLHFRRLNVCYFLFFTLSFFFFTLTLIRAYFLSCAFFSFWIFVHCERERKRVCMCKQAVYVQCTFLRVYIETFAQPFQCDPFRPSSNLKWYFFVAIVIIIGAAIVIVVVWHVIWVLLTHTIFFISGVDRMVFWANWIKKKWHEYHIEVNEPKYKVKNNKWFGAMWHTAENFIYKWLNNAQLILLICMFICTHLLLFLLVFFFSLRHFGKNNRKKWKKAAAAAEEKRIIAKKNRRLMKKIGKN